MFVKYIKLYNFKDLAKFAWNFFRYSVTQTTHPSRIPCDVEYFLACCIFYTNEWRARASECESNGRIIFHIVVSCPFIFVVHVSILFSFFFSCRYVAHLWRRGKRRLIKKWRLFKYRRQQKKEQTLGLPDNNLPLGNTLILHPFHSQEGNILRNILLLKAGLDYNLFLFIC